MSERKFIAHTATYSPRIDVLRDAADNYSRIFDLWVVYLNDVEEVPEFLKRDTIRVILGKESHGDMKDLAKFFLAESVEKSETHFMLDDDLVLPADFATRMDDVLTQNGRKAVVGTYGGFFKKVPLDDYNLDRVGLGTELSSIPSQTEVQWLGSGIIAYDPHVFKIGLADAPEHHMGDIWLSVAAWKQKIPLLLIPHKKNWVQFNPLSLDTPCVFDMTTTPKSRYFAEVLNKFIADCPNLTAPAILTQKPSAISSFFSTIGDAFTFAKQAVDERDEMNTKLLFTFAKSGAPTIEPLRLAETPWRFLWESSEQASPLVSVIMPVESNAVALRASIEFLLAQTYKNIEIILIEDGKTDGGSDVSVAYQDPRIVQISMERSQGRGVALNAGLAIAKGPLIVRQGTEAIAPEFMAKLVAAFAKDPQLVLCWGRSVGSQENERPTERWADAMEVSNALLLGSGIPTTDTVMMRKLFVNGRMLAYPESRNALDYEFYCGYLLSGGSIRSLLCDKGVGLVSSDATTPKRADPKMLHLARILRRLLPLEQVWARRAALGALPALISNAPNDLPEFVARMLREIPDEDWKSLNLDKDTLWFLLRSPSSYRLPLVSHLLRHGSNRFRMTFAGYGLGFALRRVGINLR